MRGEGGGGGGWGSVDVDKTGCTEDQFKSARTVELGI